MQLFIVSGLSGAGKTVALKQFEDLGWYCIDNLPMALVQPLVAHALTHPEPRYERVVIGIDARANPREIEGFPLGVDMLRSQKVNTRILFLTASNEAILRRFGETRRKHPLTNVEVPLTEAIEQERKLLRPVADLADETLDTSDMNLHQLRAAVHARLPEDADTPLTLTFLSFGYKNGNPEGVDFIFDARCLPNPHWVPELRAMSGCDAAVATYLESSKDVSEYVAEVRRFLERWLPVFHEQGRPYVTVAIGCTGGQHRSVYLGERLAAFFRGTGIQVNVRHRDTAWVAGSPSPSEYLA